MKILDVGCGSNPYEGAIGMDYNPRTNADVIHDLDDFPYPFEDNEFDLVVSRHVVEHVPNVIRFMEELHRITRPGGRIRLITPHYTNPDWAGDPTHLHPLNSYSFISFLSDKQVFEFYTDVEMKQISAYVSLLNLWKAFGFEFLVNLDEKYKSMRFFRRFWEQYLCYMIRGKILHFEFEVVK